MSGYLAEFDEPDPSDAYQIVGYQEYANALNHLVPLVQKANAEQLAAYDKIVSNMPELAVYTNLSRRFNFPEARNSALTPLLRGTLNLYRQSSLNEQALGEDNEFRRTGIGWVIALARIEHGAIELGYQKNVSPFNLENLTQVEQAAFQELLLDGARSHYWTMRMDPMTHLILKGEVVKVNDRTALAYGRRAVILQNLLQALNHLAGATLSPVQKTELQSWFNDMTEVREGVSYIMYETYKQAISKQGIYSMDLEGCPRLVEGIRSDISLGKGRIQLEK
ncbi:MAG: hypothetical protein CMJ79_14505 [Planctomycetaceae bacterium]|nr:hypothetical protein [Planctomycetaceae bacterium]